MSVPADCASQCISGVLIIGVAHLIFTVLLLHKLLETVVSRICSRIRHLPFLGLLLLLLSPLLCLLGFLFSALSLLSHLLLRLNLLPSSCLCLRPHSSLRFGLHLSLRLGLSSHGLRTDCLHSFAAGASACAAGACSAGSRAGICLHSSGGRLLCDDLLRARNGCICFSLSGCGLCCLASCRRSSGRSSRGLRLCGVFCSSPCHIGRLPSAIMGCSSSSPHLRVQEGKLTGLAGLITLECVACSDKLHDLRLQFLQADIILCLGSCQILGYVHKTFHAMGPIDVCGSAAVGDCLAGHFKSTSRAQWLPSSCAVVLSTCSNRRSNRRTPHQESTCCRFHAHRHGEQCQTPQRSARHSARAITRVKTPSAWQRLHSVQQQL
mmetsp:Transcript_101839/g.180642  ORF Transcript_101839/g.180642 Transcript_101839/m.180642 type:complete len:379 (+) Transcript_101839:208-1344(+)